MATSQPKLLGLTGQVFSPPPLSRSSDDDSLDGKEGDETDSQPDRDEYDMMSSLLTPRQRYARHRSEEDDASSLASTQSLDELKLMYTIVNRNCNRPDGAQVDVLAPSGTEVDTEVASRQWAIRPGTKSHGLDEGDADLENLDCSDTCPVPTSRDGSSLTPVTTIVGIEPPTIVPTLRRAATLPPSSWAASAVSASKSVAGVSAKLAGLGRQMLKSATWATFSATAERDDAGYEELGEAEGWFEPTLRDGAKYAGQADTH